MESKASLSFLFTILCCVASSQAYDFLVGGRDGWVLSPSESYDSWAQRLRFQVNDALVFRYQNGTDSVLAVNRQGYDTCNTSNPILRLEGGDSRYLLERSGPFYFITGNQTNCVAGQKLILIVMSPRSPPTTPLPTPATPPGGAPSPQVQPPSGGVAPTPGGGLAPTPTSSGGLAPTPGGGQAPTPTPSGGLAPTPTSSGGLAPTPGGGQAPTPTPSGGLAPTPGGGQAPTPTPSGGQAPTPSGGVAPTPTGGEGPSGSEGPSGGGGSGGGGGGGPSGSEGPSGGGGGGSDGGGGGTPPGAPQSSSPALVSSMGFSVLVIMVLGNFIGTF